MMRIERMTSPLPRECSTTEPHGHECFGAGEGNRTLVGGLEGLCSTIELHPPGIEKRIIPLRNFSLLREIHLKIFAGGGGWIRTIVGVSQQIYSLPPLATRAPLRCERTELLPEVGRLSRCLKQKNRKIRVYTHNPCRQRSVFSSFGLERPLRRDYHRRTVSHTDEAAP